MFDQYRPQRRFCEEDRAASAHAYFAYIHAELMRSLFI